MMTIVNLLLALLWVGFAAVTGDLWFFAAVGISLLGAMICAILEF